MYYGLDASFVKDVIEEAGGDGVVKSRTRPR